MKLWMVILVLSVACVNQPVRINAAEGQVIHQRAEKATEERTQQKTQQTAEKKGQIAKQRDEIVEENAEQTQDREQQTLKENSQHATQQKGQEAQQTTEEKEQQTHQATKTSKQQMQQRQQQQTTGKNAQQTQQTQQTREQQTKTHQAQQTTRENEQISTNKQDQQQIEPTQQRRKENEKQGTEERKQQEQHHQQQHHHHRILFLYPLATKSHSSFFGGIIDALVEAGNQVTVVSPHNVLKGRNGLRTIVVKEGDAGSFVHDPFQQNRFGAVFSAVSNSIVRCNDILAKPQVQELLKEEFDVVILSISLCDCFLSLVHQMNVPYIWLSPIGMAGAISMYSGTPQFPSFMGSKVLYFRHPLSFHQRVIVTLMESAFAALHNVFFLPSTENMCRERGLCPPDMPPFQDMIANGSLVILNSVKTLENPQWPSVPTEIHAGGIHCRPAKPLPKELQEWVEGAGEAGFIFFSLGSVVKGSNIPEKTRLALLETFASLDQRVLWKWDQDTMADLPPNVRLAKWLPQQDILGHPRLRLFITHGGIMSTLEASYHGVPVLGLPVFGDQHGNMQQTEAEGWGRSLKWDGLDGETVREAILGVMNDAQMRAIAKQRSVLMQDQSMTPAETVVFWVGYVVRHKGAHHLRCPAVYLPWYQVYNVDVWATVALVAVVFLCITFRVTVALCSCLCRSFVGKKKKD